ncbi:MAG TPA: elongation factor G [Syntrophomonadaceae bacterium]|nr:elongation factor G [Syntrophomonadaceae bacterium]
MTKKTALTAIRNIGIMAHIDAGKTTTTERFLYYSGKVHRMGEVDKGTATMDWMSQEQERGITITSAATTCAWGEWIINIIDTPGHVDFTVEVERSLRILDSAIGIFCAVAGVQPQSETVWRQADRYLVPRIAYINKMDRIGADFYRTVQMINDVLGCSAIPIQLPIGVEEDFNGIIDILKSKAYIYEDDLGEKFTERELNDDEKERVTYYRNLLLEKLSEYDDNILEKYLEGEEISLEEINSSLRKETINNNVVPVLCGSSFRNKGVQMLMDAVINYLPSPLDVPEVTGIDPESGETIKRQTTIDESFCALAFKATSDSYVGKLTYFRIYSGSLKVGEYIYNSTKDKKERITKILKMHANHREEIAEAYAGDIVAGVGFRSTVTGDTLCDEKRPIILENIDFPDPVIDIAIEPKTKADQDKIGESLQRLAEEDPTFVTKVNEETGQTIISGMGELHLEIIIDRLLREFNVNANVGKPQVSYKETVTAPAQAEAIFERQTGGRGLFAQVIIAVKPLLEGDGKKFVDQSSPEQIPKEFVSVISNGISEALCSGVLAGYPVDDLEVTLLGGSFHEVDSTEQAFKIAGSMAIKQGLHNAKSCLLEPIMDIEIIAPEDHVGDVIADLNSRRGRVMSMEENRESKIIKGTVPLAETFGYATSLRSASQGRATFSMLLKEYAQVPELLSKKIIAKRYGLPV